MSTDPGSPVGGAEDGSGPAAPTCYRHPARETYIRCQRCDRPICPECQIPASVGFQCPDDVKAGQREIPRTRTVLGGFVPRGDGALVTKVIIAITAVVSLLDLYVEPRISQVLALVSGVDLPGLVGADEGVVHGEVWRLLSVALVHGSVVHLLVNMFSLWVLGAQLEPVLGRARFLALYVVGALGGSALSYATNAPYEVVGSTVYLFAGVGASGAVFALIGALVPILRRMRQSLGPVLVMLAINAYLGFRYPGIDWRAHLGGLLVGLAIGAVVSYQTDDRERRRRVQLLGYAGAALVAVAVVVVRTVQLSG